MKINTRYFGEMEIDEKEIIRFEQGIPGFIEEKQFVVIPFGDEETPLNVLQSLNTHTLAFVIVNPFLFFKDYEFNITEPITNQLQLNDEKEIAVYVILTVQDPFEKTTANLKAPIVVNVEKGYGKQIVLNDEQYFTKHKLINEPLSVIKGEG